MVCFVLFVLYVTLFLFVCLFILCLLLICLFVRFWIVVFRFDYFICLLFCLCFGCFSGWLWFVCLVIVLYWKFSFIEVFSFFEVLLDGCDWLLYCSLRLVFCVPLFCLFGFVCCLNDVLFIWFLVFGLAASCGLGVLSVCCLWFKFCLVLFIVIIVLIVCVVRLCCGWLGFRCIVCV